MLSILKFDNSQYRVHSFGSLNFTSAQYDIMEQAKVSKEEFLEIARQYKCTNNANNNGFNISFNNKNNAEQFKEYLESLILANMLIQ